MSETYTRDMMVAELSAPQEVEAASEPVAKVETQEDLSAPTDESISEVEEPGDGAEDLDGLAEEDTVEAEAEAVDAPKWWDAEDKAVFATLTPEQQAAVAKNEAKREAITAKSKQEAAEQRKAAEAKVGELTGLAERLAQALPKAEQAFQSRWEGATAEVWQELAASDPLEYIKLRAEFDAEMGQLQHARAAEAQASEVAQANHYATQAARLRELNPVLVSDAKSMAAVGEYIVKTGIAPEAIMHASAEELNMAWKAMKYDEAQAKAKAHAEGIKPALKTSAKAVAPTARVSTLPPQQREMARLQNRFNQTGSKEDLVNLMAAQG
jgi:hypothetical protein